MMASEGRATRIGVLVPTFRRPQELARCLTAIRNQSRRADQIIVVVRDGDEESLVVLRQVEFAEGFPTFELVKVSLGGVVHALSQGLLHANTDILALTDDDAEPHRDWLERIEGRFAANSSVAGVGGRDLIGGADDAGPGRDLPVGQLQWQGRVIGNHHLSSGEARFVHVLKGVNCAYRTELLRQVGFEVDLRGTGAQVHFETALGLRLLRSGFRLVYDPAIRVDHYPAKRHDYDQRNSFSHRALSDEVHNETLAILRHVGISRRAVYVIWCALCGTRAYPGLVCWAVQAASGRPNAFRRLLAALQGRWMGLQTWRQTYQAQ